MGCAGLLELDRALMAGHRPVAATIEEDGVGWLAPFDTERSTYAHHDPRPGFAGTRIGHGPSVLGQDALVDLPGEAGCAAVEIGVAALLGDELRAASAREAKDAILGLAILVDWARGDVDPRDPRCERGLRVQLGPTLTAASALGRVASLRGRARVGAREIDLGTLGELPPIEESVAALSHTLTLRAGDVVGIGPLPRGSSDVHRVAVPFHDRVEVTIERLGVLRGAAVERRELAR